MADSLINPTNYTFIFDTATDDIIVVDNYTFSWSTVTTPTGTADFNLYQCGTPTPNFNLQSCDYVSPIMPIIDAYGGEYIDLSFSVTIVFYAALGRTGEYATTSLTTNPVDELSCRQYHGATASASLFTESRFNDVDAYHGAYTDADFTIYPPAELDADAYHGATVDADLSLNHQLDADAYHGSYVDADATTYPAQTFDADAYHGATVDVDIEIPWTILAYHGSYVDADVTDAPSEGLGDTPAYHGSYVDADLAPAYNLGDTLAYHGAYAEGTQLSFATTFDADAYHGAYADADFTEVLGYELDADAYHGATGVVDTLAVQVALFPRAYSGATANVDIEIHPAIEVTFDFYHGATVNIPVLDETNWNMYAYHGSTVDVDIALQLNLPADAYHGSYGSIEYLNGTAALDADAYHGGYGTVISTGFIVPQGEGLQPLAYHGATLIANTDIKIHAILVPHPIIAGTALYDADNNHNHCPTSYVDPHYGDTVTRFDWNDFTEGTDFLVTDGADSRITRNWYPCSTHVVQCNVELHTQPRFKFNAYDGSNLIAYMPKKFESFGAVPLDVLYDENTNFINIRRMYFEVDFYEGANTNVYNVGADDFLATVGVTCSVELTPTAFADFGFGSSVDVNLSTSVPSWRSGAFRDAIDSTLNFFTFEHIFWTKFCHGYIRPIGEAVNFDFASIDNTGCEGKYYTEAGEHVVCNLSVEQALWPEEIKTGNNMYFTLTYQSIWLLLARGGEHLAMASNVTFEPNARDGSFAQAAFYNPPIFGYGGEHVSFDTLTVTGAAVAWVTDEDCLPNLYIPLTKDGDLDYAALDPDNDGIRDLPEVCVEQHEFYYPLLAQCVAYEAQ